MDTPLALLAGTGVVLYLLFLLAVVALLLGLAVVCLAGGVDRAPEAAWWDAPLGLNGGA